jgi:prolyl-tRNA synthetase
MVFYATAADADADAAGSERPTVVAAIVRGDLEANLIQVQNLAGVGELRPAHEDEIAATGMVPGFASPVGIDPRAAIFVVDRWVAQSANLVMGANRADYHLRNVCCDRDYRPTVVGQVAAAFDGAPCASCGGPLQLARGVEVGNIFQLGTRYADALEARFTDEAGAAHPIVMGSYGIGLERLLACVAEEHRDEHGLVLPVTVAPYQVALVALARKEETWQAAEDMFAELAAAGIEVLYDDRRDLSAGVKFADADLRGMPLRVVVGERSLAAGGAELSRRGEQERRIVPLNKLADTLQDEIAALRTSLTITP